MLRFISGRPNLSKSNYTFKTKHTFKTRKEQSERLLTDKPGLVPIVIEKSDGCSLNSLDKNKLLINDTATIGQLIYIIREQIKIDSTEALFLSIGHVIPSTSSTMASIYDKYKDDDGWLYIAYAAENFFG